MQLLAINGGEPVRKKPFPTYNPLGEEERVAVNKVMDTGILSQFLGTWSDDFYGGPHVQRLERAWEDFFSVKHAVSVNSATSGLYAAVGAAGVGPGDEVIVSPYTMTASATAPLVYGAVPIFADIDRESYCITAETIVKKITARTKAIIAVDIFGRPAEFEKIMSLADAHGLIVIEDCAQAPGARYAGRLAGTLGHIGVFSLNYHKTIHCGEGGVVVTDSNEFAERLQLIRNHAEAVVAKKGVSNLVNMVGFNYRMTEIEAAIAYEQLKKLPELVRRRQENAEYLSRALEGVSEIEVPSLPEGMLHGWYVYPFKFFSDRAGVSRTEFAKALRAEGVPLGEGYVEPLYLQPLYQQKIAFGKNGFPFEWEGYDGRVDYSKGLCSVAEEMHFECLLIGDWVHAAMTFEDLDDVSAAIKKVVAAYKAG